jgi:hypothetical protein
LITNINDKSQRKEFIKDLQKYLQVDIYDQIGIPCTNLENRINFNTISSFYFPKSAYFDVFNYFIAE